MKQLIEYIRKKDKPIGVFVGVQEQLNVFSVGWSLCRKNDMFTKATGKKIALARALKDRNNNNLPRSLRNQHAQFVARCNNYFKQTPTIITAMDSALNSMYTNTNYTVGVPLWFDHLYIQSKF